MISAQFQKNAALLPLTAIGVLINFDTFGVSPYFSPPPPVSPCSIPQAFRFSRYRRRLRFACSPSPRCSIFILLYPPFVRPVVDEEKSRKSLRARHRENTSVLYIFLDRPGHNSGDESVLLGPHRTHTLADCLPTSVAASLSLVSSSLFSSLPPSPRCQFARLGTIRVEERRVTLLPEPSSTDLPTPPLSRAPSATKAPVIRFPHPIRSRSPFVPFPLHPLFLPRPSSRLYPRSLFWSFQFPRRSVRPSVNLPSVRPPPRTAVPPHGS